MKIKRNANRDNPPNSCVVKRTARNGCINISNTFISHKSKFGLEWRPRIGSSYPVIEYKFRENEGVRYEHLNSVIVS